MFPVLRQSDRAQQLRRNGAAIQPSGMRPGCPQSGSSSLQGGSDLRFLPEAHGPEAGVVAEVEVQMPVERAIVVQCRPAPAADLITFVPALPGELHAVAPAVLGRAAVHPSLDGDKTE